MTKDHNLVYESPASFVDVVTLFAILAVCPTAIVFFLTRIKDFPILMSILILICSLVILSIGISSITVEKDSFTIIKGKFLLPRFTKVYTFPFTSVKEIEAWLPLTQMKEIGDNVEDLNWQPLSSPSRYTSNTLIVRFKNGHEVTLTPAIYRGAFHKALGHIRDLSAIRVTLNDREQ